MNVTAEVAASDAAPGKSLALGGKAGVGMDDRGSCSSDLVGVGMDDHGSCSSDLVGVGMDDHGSCSFRRVGCCTGLTP